MTTGRCLCGAVTLKVTDLPRAISACHCTMCQRWSGGIMFGIGVDTDDLTVTGPVKTFASSTFAERAWCGTCGSALWLRDTVDGGRLYELVPGLFENAGGAVLDHETYADRCPDGYALAGDHPRISATEYETANRHVKDGDAT